MVDILADAVDRGRDMVAETTPFTSDGASPVTRTRQSDVRNNSRERPRRIFLPKYEAIGNHIHQFECQNAVNVVSGSCFGAGRRRRRQRCRQWRDFEVIALEVESPTPVSRGRRVTDEANEAATQPDASATAAAVSKRPHPRPRRKASRGASAGEERPTTAGHADYLVRIVSIGTRRLCQPPGLTIDLKSSSWMVVCDRQRRGFVGISRGRRHIAASHLYSRRGQCRSGDGEESIASACRLWRCRCEQRHRVTEQPINDLSLQNTRGQHHLLRDAALLAGR